MRKPWRKDKEVAGLGGEGLVGDELVALASDAVKELMIRVRVLLRSCTQRDLKALMRGEVAAFELLVFVGLA